MAKLLTYEKKDTWMDRLCGVTKLIYFLAWSITSMLTYDTGNCLRYLLLRNWRLVSIGSLYLGGLQ